MAREEYILDAQGKDLVRILPGGWRNFRGAKTQYNAQGNRNFTIEIRDMDLLKVLEDRGFRVKERPGQNEGEVTYTLQIKFSYGIDPSTGKTRGPKITQYVVGNGTPTEIDEDTVDILDEVDIVDCVMKIRPYDWTMKDGATGTTAYLNELIVQIPDNRFGERFQEQ